MTGVIWVRVSSVEQAKGYSPGAQLRELKEAAERRSIEIVRTFQAAESTKVSSARKQVKEIYQATDQERKAAILGALIVKAVIRGGELHVFWKEPFAALVLLGEGVLTCQSWQPHRIFVGTMSSRNSRISMLSGHSCQPFPYHPRPINRLPPNRIGSNIYN